MKLELGVLDLVPAPAGTDSAAALRQAVLLARTAERTGYRRYWAAEHHDLPGLACSAPEVLLAHLAALTERIRLGTGALLLPHYRPVKVAETFRLLASLAPGRIDLGIGRAPGGSAHITMALSGNFLENVRRFPESLAALLELLTDEYRIEGEPVTARPVPPEAPEVWLLGTNRRSCSHAAGQGTGYVFGQFMSDLDGTEVVREYREHFRPSRLTPSPRVIVAVGAVCADSSEEARRLAANVPWSGPRETAEAANFADWKLLAGRPDEVRERLEALAEGFGTNEFLIVTPINDYRKRLRSYELLAGAVYGFAEG
jgi:luciferase family oxidoreductase group 1